MLVLPSPVETVLRDLPTPAVPSGGGHALTNGCPNMRAHTHTHTHTHTILHYQLGASRVLTCCPRLQTTGLHVDMCPCQERIRYTDIIIIMSTCTCRHVHMYMYVQYMAHTHTIILYIHISCAYIVKTYETRLKVYMYALHALRYVRCAH